MRIYNLEMNEFASSGSVARTSDDTGWKALEPGVIKINCDGAWDCNSL